MNRTMALFVLFALAALFAGTAHAGLIQQALDGGIVVRGTVVTMDEGRNILRNGGVFIRGGTIVATWQGSHAPAEAAGAIVVDLGARTYIFPGLINLHDHPTYNVLSLWPAPSSHAQPTLGRPLGTEPYANRYQWNRMTGNVQAPEFPRLVGTPHALLTNPAGLGLNTQVMKYAEVRALLGGQTAIQGESDPITDQTLIRNVEAESFSGPGRIAARVQPIGNLSEPARIGLLARMTSGTLDAWLVHLAEGVRDGERRPGDSVSSRAEFAAMRSKGLLTDATVVVHGTGLEPEDFAAMRAAPSVRLDGSGDGLGAKLVWSPLSNLLLYGRTATVYDALAAGVLVSLGTDWSPSGSRNLLDELKVADVALRDPRVLGADRERVPSLAVAGKTGEELEAAEAALDRTLVEMVTTNPARTVRWTPFLGSIEPGKRADLVVVTRRDPVSTEGLPSSAYRALIDATEEDVRLVLVDGDPLAGDVAVMQSLKPGDYETVTSTAGCFEKAVDVTDPFVAQGDQTFASIETELRNALLAMGGDHPPADGGPADLSNTYSYLKARIPGASALTDAQLTLALAAQFGLTSDGRLNMEAVQLSPPLVADDDFLFHFLGGERSAAGLIADDTPPFKLYPSNFNHIGASGDPLDATAFRDRYFEFCEGGAPAGSLASIEAGVALGQSAVPWVSLAVAPNPARRQSALALDMRESADVRLVIHDVAGRRVTTVVDRRLGPGRHRFEWKLTDDQGARVPSGVYLARLTTRSTESVTRLVVLP